MEKLYLTHIEDEIKDRAENQPIKLELTNSSDLEHPNQYLENERIQWQCYKIAKKRTERSYNYTNMVKHRVIRLMSDGRVFDAQLANDLKISNEDIIFLASKMHYLNQYIKGIDIEWKKRIIARGKLEAIAEEEATKEYNTNYNKDMASGSLSIRALFAQNTFYRNNPPTRYFVESQLKKATSSILEKHHEKNVLAEEYNNGDLTLAAYKRKDKRLSIDIKVLLAKKNQAYNDIFKNAASNKRITYIRAMPHKSQLHITPPIINVTSWRHGIDLISDYRDWYNELHKDAIEKARDEKSKHSDRVSYHRKQDVIERQLSKKEKQNRFADLIEEGFSQAEAGRQVGITSSTANRWANNSDICIILPNE